MCGAAMYGKGTVVVGGDCIVGGPFAGTGSTTMCLGMFGGTTAMRRDVPAGPLHVLSAFGGEWTGKGCPCEDPHLVWNQISIGVPGESFARISATRAAKFF